MLMEWQMHFIVIRPPYETVCLWVQLSVSQTVSCVHSSQDKLPVKAHKTHVNKWHDHICRDGWWVSLKKDAYSAQVNTTDCTVDWSSLLILWLARCGLSWQLKQQHNSSETSLQTAAVWTTKCIPRQYSCVTLVDNLLHVYIWSHNANLHKLNTVYKLD